MKRKSLKTLSILALAGVAVLGLNACGSTSSSTNSTTSGGTSVSTSKPGGSSDTPTSVIKSLTAKSEKVAMKIDESLLITSYYTLTGYSSLSAAQKVCETVSSDPSVVLISSKVMRAVGLGKSTITVTSKIDPTKKCTFEVTVKDVTFDRNFSIIDPTDDFSKELPEDGGIIETKSSVTGDYLFKGVDAKKWYTSVEITIQSISSSELFPKFGIVTSTTTHTELENNKVYYFLNAAVGTSNVTTWDSFGVCEVSNNANWAWNQGVDNATARHKDDMHKVPADKKISVGTKFKMAMARDGFDFHMWVNDVYAGSMTVLSDLFGAKDGSNAYQPVDSMVGFFQFNSVAKYENYSVTADATQVDAKINAIGAKTFITEWAAD